MGRYVRGEIAPPNRLDVGPFLAVFLTSARHWEAGAAGMALTVGGIATVLARAPAGEIVDILRAKRTLIALAAAVVAVAGHCQVNRCAGMRRLSEGIVGITLFGGRRSPAARPGMPSREFGDRRPRP